MLPIVLLLLATLAIVLFARSFFIGIRKRHDTINDQMEVAARICQAAARDAFDVELDRSLDSLTRLDDLIDRGFGGGIDITEDMKFVLAAYFGQVLSTAYGGAWQPAIDEHHKPTLVLTSRREPVSPFQAIEQKLHTPGEMSLEAEARLLIDQDMPDQTHAD